MEKKNTKLFMAAAVIALLTVAGGSLYAEPNLFNSPQKQATATQFWSDADLFLSPYRYTDVEFEKWFGTVSFQSDMFTTSSTQMLQLGFATKLSGMYAAVYYGGNTLALPEEIYREEDGKRVYSQMPELFKPSINPPYNEGAVLIGFMDMGFRLSYVHTYRSIKLNDFAGPSDNYKSYTDEKGSINPEIAWGMTKQLIPGKGIQPHVYIDLDFFRDYQKQDIGSGDEIKHSNNEFTLGFTAKAGGFSLFEQNGFDFGVDLWYTLHWKAFNNEYTPKDYDDITDPGNPVWVPRTGTIKTYNGVFHQVEAAPDPAQDYYRTGYHDHLVTPYLYATWSGEKLSLSAEASIELGFTGEKGTQFNLNGDKPVKNGFDFDAFTFSLVPNLDLGLQWAIVPDKFYLNAGTSIKFFEFSVKTSAIDTYSNDIKGNTAKEIDKTFAEALTKLMLGFTFNPTANVGVQAMSGVDFQTNSINLFDTTANSGLAVFSQIMVTLKF